MSETLQFEMRYEWQPFTYQGRHLTFADHVKTRLTRTESSHWGAVVYKWEGMLDEGQRAGMRGTLIGETHDLRGRIKQYVSGTQEAGNKYWRENFLTKGNIRLSILRLHDAGLKASTGISGKYGPDASRSGNFRVILEQLLVLRELESKDPRQWIVNRKL